MRKTFILASCINLLLLSACSGGQSFTSEDSIVSVKSYGFVDLEGAKPQAIIVEYNQSIKAKSVSADSYSVNDYVAMLEKQGGYDSAIEIDKDGVQGNEGQITKVYVNDNPEPSPNGGVKKGNYVILELNTAYMMNGQNLPYTTSMMAGVTPLKEIACTNGTILPSEKEFSNYTATESESVWGKRTSIDTNKDEIILPEFEKGSGWTLNYIGDGAFHAKNCYSEYTGKYYDFDLPYAIYVPSKEILEEHKGDISLVIHMEHAGGNSTDPMSGITSSMAAVKLAGEKVQKENPAIIVVPQVEESRRSTDDQVGSSEVNTACWELLDSLLAQYKGYINEERIYGTGQSMGGMTILNMSAQRDNFFAGAAIIGAQWSNSYNKDFQHDGSPARSPENDKISFNGFGLDKDNYQNWYYMISDDNILVHTCKGDPMATGLWQYVSEYFAAAGVTIPTAEIDPYASLEQQNEEDRKLYTHDNEAPGSGISWGLFNKGSHMSTWKYAYQLDAPFEWLFAQRRSSALLRGKVDQLKSPWLGRDKDGNIKAGSGTDHLNTAQFTPSGASKIFCEGWTPKSVGNQKEENGGFHGAQPRNDQRK